MFVTDCPPAPLIQCWFDKPQHETSNSGVEVVWPTAQPKTYSTLNWGVKGVALHRLQFNFLLRSKIVTQSIKSIYRCQTFADLLVLSACTSGNQKLTETKTRLMSGLVLPCLVLSCLSLPCLVLSSLGFFCLVLSVCTSGGQKLTETTTKKPPNNE